ncbi:MAG: hypothetical protein NUV67_02245, partial [archaeon]|nr:hypothetical protein [archaeon]
MFLEKPALLVSLNPGAAEEKVSSLLISKNWKPTDFSFSSTDLLYIPFWLFTFDVSEEEKSKTKLLSSGFHALNAFNHELDDKVANIHLLENSDREFEPNHDYAFRALKPKVLESEARGIIALKIADKLKTSKAKVLVSGLELVYVPIWVLSVALGEENISLSVNASDGKIINGSQVPEKKKGFSELTAEALEELTNPAQWLRYSVEIVSDFTKGA